MVPGYMPFALLLALEAVAVLVWVAVFARRRTTNAVPICARCADLHARTEIFARGADAIAVGALAFLVALPFVAAGYERALDLWQVALAVSAVVAAVALAAEINFFARLIAVIVWPRLNWSFDVMRVIGSGARWLGVFLALYVFKSGYTGAGAAASGFGGLFGGAGGFLVRDLASTLPVWLAAVMLLGSTIVAVAARWIAPSVFFSRPMTFAARSKAA